MNVCLSGCINQRDGVTSIILTIKTNLSTFAIRSQQCARHKSAQIDRKRLKICHTQMCHPSLPLPSSAPNYHKCFWTTLAALPLKTFAQQLLASCPFVISRQFIKQGKKAAAKIPWNGIRNRNGAENALQVDPVNFFRHETAQLKSSSRHFINFPIMQFIKKRARNEKKTKNQTFARQVNGKTSKLVRLWDVCKVSKKNKFKQIFIVLLFYM